VSEPRADRGPPSGQPAWGGGCDRNIFLLSFDILPFFGPAAASIKLTTQTMSAMTRKRIILIRKRPSSRMYTRGKPGNGPSSMKIKVGSPIAVGFQRKHFRLYRDLDNSKVAVAGTLRDSAPTFAMLILTGSEVAAVGNRTIRSSGEA
jgi:hypothetical protein